MYWMLPAVTLSPCPVACLPHAGSLQGWSSRACALVQGLHSKVALSINVPELRLRTESFYRRILCTLCLMIRDCTLQGWPQLQARARR